MIHRTTLIRDLPDGGQEIIPVRVFFNVIHDRWNSIEIDWVETLSEGLVDTTDTENQRVREEIRDQARAQAESQR